MQSKNLFYSFYTLLFLFVLSLHPVFSQIKSFQLKDSETNEPIVSATYTYGSQTGLTDINGSFKLSLEALQECSFSHVSYGNWTISTESLKQLKDGMILRTALRYDLYPVTVIAVHPQQSSSDKLQVEFQDKLSHDAATILSQTATVSGIRKSAAYGFDPVIRGFKYDQINVVIQGVQTATAACPNRMDPPTSQVAGNMTERVEILKGPHALRYGVGLGATVNFIPTEPRYASGLSSSGRFSTGYEGNGSVKRTEGFLDLTGNRVSFGLYGSYSDGNDYYSGNGDRVDSDFLRASFGSTLGIKLSDYQKIKLSATFNKAKDTEYPALPMDLRKDETWLFNGRHDWEINHGALTRATTTIYGSMVDHLMDNLLKEINPRTMNASTPAKSFTVGGRTELQWQWNSVRVYSGIDTKTEGTEGIRERTMLMGPMAGMSLFDNAWQEGQISQYGIFAEFHRYVNKHTFTLSTRLDVNHSTVNNPSDEFLKLFDDTDATQINPSVSLGWNYRLSNEWTTSVWLARAQRSGSLTERFINYFPVGFDPYELVGNPQLKPEINNQLDFSVQWAKSNISVNTDVFLSYMNQAVTSYIDTSLTPRIPTSPGVRRFTSVSEALKAGFEWNVNHRLTNQLSHNLSLAYTWAQDLDKNQPLPEIAPLDVRYRIKHAAFSQKLNTSVQLRYVFEQNRIATDFGETASPDFFIVDAVVSYALPFRSKLQLGMYNLFNAQYAEHLNRINRVSASPIYSPGRNIVLSLSASF